MGGRLLTWMWVCVIFVIFWFLLTLWLLVLLVGESLWTAAAWSVTAAVKVRCVCHRLCLYSLAKPQSNIQACLLPLCENKRHGFME